MVNLTLDRFIRLDTDELDARVIRDVQDVLTIPNQEKIQAQRQHLWGADRLDDHVSLYAWHGEQLLLPRGFFIRLKQGLEAAGYQVNVINNMTYDRENRFPFLGTQLRDYQRVASKQLQYFAQGIYQAPTGSGKTVTMLHTIAALGQKSLVIVNKKELVQQWNDRAEQTLKMPGGFIGDGRWEDSQDLVIAMQQTLWARRDEIPDEWWAQWGFVLLDECHAVQAETYHEVIERFSATYRFGVSATPKKTGDFKICESVLGPIIHSTPKKPLREQGYLITPQVFTIPTDFYYPFERDQLAENRHGKKYVKKKNNWHDVVARLIIDVPRNTLIADTAQSLDKRTILILSKRLEHLEQLRLLLKDKREVLLLTGAESLDERMKVYERASCGNCIILSTLADEAVDIPRIDTLFLVFPTKNTDVIKQQIGRGERPHPEKKDFLIYDFVDFAIPPIKSQYRDRKNFVYRPEDISVTKVTK